MGYQDRQIKKGGKSALYRKCEHCGKLCQRGKACKCKQDKAKRDEYK
jgi:hypothetical protein